VRDLQPDDAPGGPGGGPKLVWNEAAEDYRGHLYADDIADIEQENDRAEDAAAGRP
jgi:hypothetical protein